MSSSNYQPMVPPPAYSTFDAAAPTAQRRSSSSSQASTPAYEASPQTETAPDHHGRYAYRIEENEEATGSPPPYSAETQIPVRQSKSASTQQRQQQQTHNDSSSSSTSASTSSSLSPNTSSAVPSALTSKTAFASTTSSFLRHPFQAYGEKKREKRREEESKKKVDWYEKHYGFVPKNVMSEAEWRARREAMPVTTMKGSFRARPAMLF